MTNTAPEQRTEPPETTAVQAPRRPRPPLLLGWYLVFAALVGIYSSAMVTIDRIRSLEDPGFIAPCDINHVIACSDVMSSPQAEALGFPNTLLGLIGFGMVLAVGVAILAGARFVPWFWFGVEIGSLLAVIAVHWFVHAAVFELRALCLYCMSVWAVSVPIFVYVTAFNFAAFGPPESAVVRWCVRLRHVIAWGWVLALGLVVLAELWPLLFS